MTTKREELQAKLAKILSTTGALGCEWELRCFELEANHELRLRQYDAFEAACAKDSANQKIATEDAKQRRIQVGMYCDDLRRLGLQRGEEHEDMKCHRLAIQEIERRHYQSIEEIERQHKRNIEAILGEALSEIARAVRGLKE